MLQLTRFAMAALSVSSLSGCALVEALRQYDAISEAPPKGGLQEPMRPRASTLQPSLVLPLSSLQAAANAAAGKLLPFSGGGSQRIAKIEIRDPIFNSCILCESLDVNWRYTAGLAGPVTVSGGADLLSLTMPVRLDGGFGFGGALAGLFGLSNKTVAAAAELSFRSRLRADQQFCPAFHDTTLDYRWLQGPEVEIVGQNCVLGVCVGPWRYNFASHIDPTIRAAIPGIVGEIERAIPCGPVRAELQKVWRNHSVPVTLPYAGKMYLNIAPKALYFPGLGVTAQDALLSGRLDALVSLDAAPAHAGPLPLPLNEPLAIAPGRFSLAVPVSSRYYTFEALAKQELVGKFFTAQTPLGEISVQPTRISIYPSGERLALGIGFVLRDPRSVFGTSATVWLSAKPVAVDGGKKIRLTDITVTRKFSNPLWNLASVLLQDTLAKAIADGFELDLRRSVGDAQRQLGAMLVAAGQGSGVKFAARDIDLRVERILTNDQLFQVEVVLDATVDARLGTLPFAVKE